MPRVKKRGTTLTEETRNNGSPGAFGGATLVEHLQKEVVQLRKLLIASENREEMLTRENEILSDQFAELSNRLALAQGDPPSTNTVWQP